MRVSSLAANSGVLLSKNNQKAECSKLSTDTVSFNGTKQKVFSQLALAQLCPISFTGASESNMPPLKFGTSGWRAVMGPAADQFNEKNVKRVAQGIADYLINEGYKGQTVLLTSDVRENAREFTTAAAKVLIQNGINVMMTENPSPTPVAAVYAIKHGCAGTINLTASHNPPKYQGMKFNPEYGGPAYTSITDEIQDLIADNKTVPDISDVDESQIKFINPKKDYIEGLKKQVDFSKIKEFLQNNDMKIFYDPMHGTGSGYLDKILKEELSADCTLRRGNHDPYMGNGDINGKHGSEPDAKLLAKTLEAIKESPETYGKPAIGFATDGDADRFGIMDENGQLILADEVLALAARHLMKNKDKDGSLMRTVATSHMLDKLAEKYDKNLIETPVGFKYFAEKMIKENEKVILAGEESAGLTIGGYIPEKDGMLPALLMLEAMAYENKSLVELRADLKEDLGGVEFIKNRMDLKVPADKKDAIVKLFKETPPEDVAGIKVTKTTDMDGGKLYLEDGSWALVRPSGTEPVLRVYTETSSLEKEEKLQTALKEIIAAV